MTSPLTASTDHALLESLRTDLMDQLQRGTLDLPLLPQVANQVLLLTSDAKADAAKLSSLIQQDQALAGQILRIANSPAYMPRSPVVSLQQAVAWLGLNMLAGIAFSVSVQSGVFHVHGYEREVKTLWRHALATGLYGKEIARHIRHNVENAFLCGLLHAVGKPVLLHALLKAVPPREPRPPWLVIQALMEECYVDFGVKLAEAWGLPEPVREAIGFHQDQWYARATSPTKGAMITCLARHLAFHLLDPSGVDEERIRSLPVVRDLNFYPEELTGLFELGETIHTSVECMIL